MVQILKKRQKGNYSDSCFAFSDGDELKKSLSELADTKNDKSISRISSGSNPFLDIAHDPNAAVYKAGFLARKIHADMDGKKSKTNKSAVQLNQRSAVIEKSLQTGRCDATRAELFSYNDLS